MVILGQLGIIFLFGIVGEIVSFYLPFPVPSSVIAMLLLLIAVRSQLLKPERIGLVADFISKNMAFFFLPSAVKIVQVYPIVRAVLIPVLIISTLSTLVTFIVTYSVTRLLQIFFKKGRRT